MISLKELQNLLMKKEFNPYVDIDDIKAVMLHYIEECGELIRSCRKSESFEAVSDELGDCQIMLIFVAESLHLDLERCTINKINQNIKKGKFKPTNEALLDLKGIFG